MIQALLKETQGGKAAMQFTRGCALAQEGLPLLCDRMVQNVLKGKWSKWNWIHIPLTCLVASVAAIALFLITTIVQLGAALVFALAKNAPAARWLCIALGLSVATGLSHFVKIWHPAWRVLEKIKIASITIHDIAYPQMHPLRVAFKSQHLQSVADPVINQVKQSTPPVMGSQSELSVISNKRDAFKQSDRSGTKLETELHEIDQAIATMRDDPYYTSNPLPPTSRTEQMMRTMKEKYARGELKPLDYTCQQVRIEVARISETSQARRQATLAQFQIDLESRLRMELESRLPAALESRLQSALESQLKPIIDAYARQQAILKAFWPSASLLVLDLSAFSIWLRTSSS